MTRILVLNGPNLSTLGRREPAVYGGVSWDESEHRLRARAGDLGVELRIEQSNHEGRLIDVLEEEWRRSAAVILNPGGLSHTSVALHDAIRAFGAPVIEVHITNVHAREEFRHRCLTAGAATAVVAGLGVEGYIVALEALCRRLQPPPSKESTT